jgi:hypothetical protein
MELLTPPSAVLLCRIAQPVIFYQHTIYCMWTEAGQFLAGNPPTILDRHGEPMALVADLLAGSTVRVHVIDDELQTVQIISRKTHNPFAEAT